MSAEVLYQVFPVHDQDKLQVLQRKWVRKVLNRQPIGADASTNLKYENSIISGLYLFLLGFSEKKYNERTHVTSCSPHS